MIVGVPKETAEGERRVALVPELVPLLTKAGLDIRMEPGAGAAAGFPDASYQNQKVSLESGVLSKSDIVLKVQPPTLADVPSMKEGAVLIGFLSP